MELECEYVSMLYIRYILLIDYSNKHIILGSLVKGYRKKPSIFYYHQHHHCVIITKLKNFIFHIDEI